MIGQGPAFPLRLQEGVRFYWQTKRQVSKFFEGSVFYSPGRVARNVQPNNPLFFLVGFGGVTWRKRRWNKNLLEWYKWGGLIIVICRIRFEREQCALHLSTRYVKLCFSSVRSVKLVVSHLKTYASTYILKWIVNKEHSEELRQQEPSSFCDTLTFASPKSQQIECRDAECACLRFLRYLLPKEKIYSPPNGNFP